MKKIFYRVQQNDTLNLIADKFNVAICSIIKDNNLTEEVCEGDILVINLDGERYVVQLSDTIMDISNKFNKSTNQILTENGIDYIFYGLTIKI